MKKKSIPFLTESEGMSAMTDVVFLLLIFFIVTMTAYVETTLLDVKIPSAGVSSAELREPDYSELVKIEIPAFAEATPNAEPSYVVNGVPLDRMSLLRMLQRYSRLTPDVEILIRCHPDSEHRQLVALLADASALKLQNLKLVK